MPKFTLIAEHDSEEKITYEFNEDYLPNVLQQMELCLFIKVTNAHKEA